MKRISIVAMVFAALALYAQAPAVSELKQVHAVYILSMANGMDQYLANRLTRDSVFRVVTDPNLADAVMTEYLGAGFEEKFNELYPAPPAEPVKEAKVEKESDKAEKEESAPSPRGQAVEEWARPKSSSWSRGKGNFFIVDRKSKQVLWSVFEKPRDRRPQELDRAADRVVDRLKKDLGTE